MKKILFTLLSFVIIHFAVAQEKKVFPNYSVFESLENIVGEFLGYIKKSKLNPLTPAEFENCIKVTDRAEAMMNLDWQRVYIGYIKRVEANVCFKTAQLISQQPGFYTSQPMMKQAQKYIESGFAYLNQYDHRNYPPGIDEGNNKVATISVDDDAPRRLLAYINENTGDPIAALRSYYGHFDQLYNLYVANGNLPEDYMYTLANHILDLSVTIQQYDQNLVNFCFGVLVYNDHGKYQSDWMKPAEITRWSILKEKLLKTLDQVVENAPKGSKYRFTIPEDYLRNTEKSWVLPLFNKFDTHDMLSTMTADGAGNRTTLDLIQYSLLVVDQHVGGDAEAAANALLQKHFNELIGIAKTWYKETGSDNCGPIHWIASLMDKYPTDQQGKDYIKKRVKKCKNRGY